MPFTRERNREKERERESMEFTDDIIPPNIIPFYIFTDINVARCLLCLLIITNFGIRAFAKAISALRYCRGVPYIQTPRAMTRLAINILHFRAVWQIAFDPALFDCRGSPYILGLL